MSSSSIPDSMSTADLMEFMMTAVETAKTESKSDKPMTKAEMRVAVADAVETVTDKFDTMFGYKLVAIYSLACLFKHNNDVHHKICETGDFDTGLCWGRDAGQLQLMLKELTDIYCGPEDFLAGDDEPEAAS